MPISNPDLVNSCRVCRSPNQDGDYQCLYQYTQNHENQVLTEAGILYKNLLDISIKVHDCYPQFLCNSCDLQMKLFKKLKDKAYKTLEYLQGLYNDIDNAKEFDQEAASEDYESIKSDEEDESHHETQGAENEFEVYGENEIYDYEENIEESQDALAGEENLLLISDLRKFNEKEYHDSVDDECEIEIANINTAQGETEIGYFAKKYLLKVEPIENMSHESRNSADNIRLKFEQLLDKNDYVTEIYEVLDDENCFETCTENNDESLLQYDVLSENNAYISEFSDREYTKRENMDDFQNAESSEKIENNRRKLRPIRRKREYQCLPCGLKFDNVQDHKLHRTGVHNDKHPCNMCYKEFKSMSALYHHKKIHNGQPAHQCEICQKTFNQKAHYQYHMNGHNNIRNYKCDLCEKAFITKTDLKVHLRFHTGQRSYVCNICGKDYLMMEHLKSHLLSHTDQYFQCDICNKKFTTHKTLALHVRSIHTDEPRFKCTFCMKPFRRKHHLQSHMRHHQKNIISLDSAFEMVDDPDDTMSNEMDVIDIEEQKIIDSPGFIAFSELTM